MYCTKCGTKNDEDSMFCIKCGAKIDGQAKKDVKIAQKFDVLKSTNGNIFKVVIVIFVLLTLFSAIFLSIQYINNKNESDNNIQGDQDFVNVYISSTPSGANVYINNTLKGMTPVAVNLRAGIYLLKMNITGYKTIESNLPITSDMDKQEVHVKFEPIGGVNSVNTSI
jgi:hypothetical protein